MLDHLNKNKLKSRQQHGFLARHSSNTQLLESCNDWAVHLSNIKQVDIAYLDFAKSFDPVVHNKLMFKLNAYGFDGLLNSWIREFLANRYECVKVGNCLSSVCNENVGVPQGSVVGPLVFIIYVNVLSDVANNYKNTVTFKLFADDAKLYSCINNLKNMVTMQHCLVSVLQWAEVWQLTLSVAKCKIFVIGNVKFSNVYKLGGTRLPNVSHSTGLGIVMVNQLTFNLQINGIIIRAK